MNDRHEVLFVGAGPGDPDLITVAGRKALERAQLVVYAGSLVSREMLDWTAPDCGRLDSAGLALPAIVQAMVDGHRQGLKVVRLHTGDPSLYGAVSEQFRALDQAGVPWRVIPGVSAALAAAALVGMEYTLPQVCQSLIITRAAGRTPRAGKREPGLHGRAWRFHGHLSFRRPGGPGGTRPGPGLWTPSAGVRGPQGVLARGANCVDHAGNPGRGHGRSRHKPPGPDPGGARGERGRPGPGAAFGRLQAL